MGHSLQGLCCAGQFVRAVAAHICKGSQLFCAHRAHVCVHYLALAEINPRVESMKHAGRTFVWPLSRAQRPKISASRACNQSTVESTNTSPKYPTAAAVLRAATSLRAAAVAAAAARPAHRAAQRIGCGLAA